MNYAVYAAPFGKLYAVFDGSVLHAINTLLPKGITQQEMSASWQKKWEAYFTGKRPDFACPPSPHGTPFQCAVWQEIARIPYGQTVTYSDLAAILRSHPRAIGQACGKNPLPIVIPCHRVTAKNRALGGFSLGKNENNLAIKRFLLNLEGAL